MEASYVVRVHTEEYTLSETPKRIRPRFAQGADAVTGDVEFESDVVPVSSVPEAA